MVDIACSSCGKHICFYQKDGSGNLKRMYLDRIIDANFLQENSQLTCPNCKKLLGSLIVYQKENRLAFKLFLGSVTKKITKSGKINIVADVTQW